MPLSVMQRPLLDDPLAYWDRRHQALGPWRSGGDRGLTAEENYEFYAIRVGRLLELIRRHVGRERGLRILDAGCGRGHFTDALRRCGHLASGIDPSETAVAQARAAYGPHFEVARLDDHRPRTLFDVIVCVDVLFHVLDEQVWRASIAGLARCASAEAVVVVTDVFPAAQYAPRDYIVHRSLDSYDHAFAEHDFGRAELLPYEFGANPIQFAVYRRGT